MGNIADFHGGLIFYGTPGGALAKCSCIIADTLEEYGHSVDHFSAMAGDVISLACDQYRLVVRMSDLSMDPQTETHQPELQRVVLSLKPNFPRYCDQELSEMLMAILLYRLVPALDADEIEWMDPDATLTKEQFIGAFSHIRPTHDALPDTEVHSRFAPVDETLPSLELQCAAIQPDPAREEKQISRFAPHSRFATWASSLIHSSEMRFAARVPPLAACAVFFQSSGVV